MIPDSPSGPAGWFGRHRHVALAVALLGVAMAQVALMAVRSGPLNSLIEYLALEAALAGIAALALAAALVPPLGRYLERVGAGIGAALGRLAWAAWLLLLTLLPVLTLGGWGRFFQPLWVRASALWLLGLAASTLISSAWPGSNRGSPLVASLLGAGAIYQAATQLPVISGDPLSLGWSEASRYYYASLYLSRRLYGFSAPLSVLHPSRYLLQAIPFLLASSPIWLHRLWQSLLWLGLPLLTVLLLVRRLQAPDGVWRGLFLLWGFLFLFQGPILYHLLPAAMPVLWERRIGGFGRTLLLVLLGSIWAGISRLNWFAVPGFTAAALYLLEQPRQGRSRWRYWLPPLACLVVGGLAAALANAAYILLSGNAVSEFGSSFTSDLFWYRLLPNPTFAPGILLATALASLPGALVLWRARRAPARELDSARWLPLAGMLGILLVGGVVVSLKIGGGSNLHNLDGYLLLLLVVSGYVAAGHVTGWESGHRPRFGWGGYLLVLGIPLLFNLNYGEPIMRRDPAVSQQVIRELREQIAALGPDPQVLLISERQLLSFGELGRIALLPDYEKVFLMEMAMSGTQPYLQDFHTALQEQRFDLIVSDPLNVQFQGRTRAFGEENDAWVQQVSVPTLCYYEPIWTADGAAVQLLRPRADAPVCPDLPLGS